jgi:hypothetical protein
MEFAFSLDSDAKWTPRPEPRHLISGSDSVCLLDPVAALEKEEIVRHAAKRAGMTNLPVLPQVLAQKIEHGRESPEVVVRLNVKLEPSFVHASIIAPLR